MRCGRNLEETPSLIDPDPADDFGRMRAGIGVRSGAVGADRTGDAQVVDGGAVPHGRIIETDRGRYAVAELGGVLNVVDAGVGILAAEQVRGDVARETLPRRGVGRGGFAEGEAGELEKDVLDCDIAAARNGSARLPLRAGNALSVAGLELPKLLNWKSPCPKVRTSPYSVAVRVSIVSAIRERETK